MSKLMQTLTCRMEQLMAMLVAEGKPRWELFKYYAKVELVPPTLQEVPLVAKEIENLMVAFKNGKWKQVTVQEAVLNSLITIEVGCWFFMGECIGKHHIAGYNV